MKLTIREIAKIADVSITTVSLILNGKGDRFSDETKRKVFKVVEENHYTPNYFASNIIKKKSQLIGIVVPTIKEPFAATLINLIQKELSQKNYHLITSESFGEMEEEKKILERYAQFSVEAIFCFTGTVFPSEWFKGGCFQEIPVVFIDKGINHSPYGNVYLNEYETVFKAMEWLIEKGHQKIGLIKDNGIEFSFPERGKAYKDALQKHGIPINDKRITSTDFSVESGYLGAQKIMKNSEVTAIFCSDDNLALGCYQAVFDSGKRVNEEIEIIGFDGIELLKNIRPQIKTLENPFEEFAHILSYKVLQAINHPKEKQEDCYLEMTFNLD